MELTEAQKNILKRVTGRKEVTIQDFFEVLQNLKWEVDDTSGMSMWGEKVLITDADSPVSNISKARLMNYTVHKLRESQEYILCSAIYFDDGEAHVHQPDNILSGFVLCGRRHHNIFAQLKALGIPHTLYTGKRVTQGFLTSLNRFVNRTEGGRIAHQAGQTKDCVDPLFSKDLW